MGIGAALVAVVVAGIVVMQWNAHIEIKGQILKVRTAPLDEHSSVVAIDFRFSNPARYAFVVKSVTVTLEGRDGKQYEGATTAEVDTDRLFEGVPLLGRKYNPSLHGGDKVAAGASEDRMVAARFELPNDRLEGRKRFVLEIEEVDGAVSQIAESAPAR
jgi:hypothetical protein